VSVQSQDEYEDLLGLWADLEAGLGVILASPASIQEFQKRVWQYDRWMQGLLKSDTDVALYLLFQLATNSSVGYSASHALVSAVLCHLLAHELKIDSAERDSLVHAAFTMNLAMTALQDRLAVQTEKPTDSQQEVIRTHATKGAQMLRDLGVADPLWIDIVTQHHVESVESDQLRDSSPVVRLTSILHMVDRYAAMISPRQTREGRSATDSARAIIRSAERNDELALALVRSVGLCPPGTYVRLDDKTVAVVMRRSNTPNQPFVAIVINASGSLLNPPRLHRTSNSSPGIKAALSASAVRERLNHHLILQLGAYAALHSK
jgi:hypothetical protein